jgi:dihydroorotate dehydrogenase (NAD+) catalytic subunit
MSGQSLETVVGPTRLKNPVIAGAAEHLIDADGVRRALRAGASAVVAKSTNESQAARDQLQQAEYMVLDENWRAVPWGRSAPKTAFVACRSGLTPQSFDKWLEQTAALDREARSYDAFVVGSLILSEIDPAVAIAKQIESAGLRILELNIGTPYASQSSRGAVSTELLPERVGEIVRTVRAAVTIPLWVKITGQSERVPDLAQSAFDAGADVVVMAGRLLGLIPDIDTYEPMLGTTLGVGGPWNLPLTCHWLAMSRRRSGPQKSLIATNGAQTGLDVVRMMLAGASAVEMSSQVMLRGFGVLSDAIAEIESYTAARNLGVTELIGRAADARKTFAEMKILPDNWRRYLPQD